MNTREFIPRSVCPAACLGLSLLLASCVKQINNPWADSGALVGNEMTTPSTEAYVRGAEQHPAAPEQRRVWPAANVYYENGVVTHWPLWFEDPFEDKGNRFKPEAERSEPDVEFAWNWVDYLHMGYGPGRMIFVNTAGLPISAVVTPPGTLMESDGCIDKGLLWFDHDAKRSDPAKREPIDVSVIRRNPDPGPPDLTSEGQVANP